MRHAACPFGRLGQLQRPNSPLTDQFNAACHAFAGLLQLRTKTVDVNVLQLVGAGGREGPNHGPFMTAFTADGQERQNFGTVGPVKPLARHLMVWRLSLNAASQGVLFVMLHIKRNTQLSARLTGTAFANDSQGRFHTFCNFLNQRLKTNGLG